MIRSCPITLPSVELLTKYLLEGAIFAKMTDFVQDQIKFCTKFDIFELQTWPNLGNFTPTGVNLKTFHKICPFDSWQHCQEPI